ncbi:MAG: cytochrome P460 family protein [Hyphomicrobiales bacterium]|nr:cytochrome P460 family protein [Hyphomicrobiales bacterium]
MIRNIFTVIVMSIVVAGCTSGTAVQNANITGSGTKDVALKLPANYKAYGPYMISDRMIQEDQVITLYANDIARKGAKTNGKLPYGSILVGEIYKAAKDGDGNVIQTSLGRRVPAELSAIVMMERQEGWDAKYPDELKVGDWEFEVFSPAGENLGKDTTACRECHHPLNETEYTFSLQHISAAN